LPTVRFVDIALQKLDGLPLMVLALARPEVHDLFPKLWADRRMQELRLRELTRKASEGLVRQVLGDAVSPDTVERLVSQADGHAFYLEELIRAVADGHGDALPETVLAMVQARLTALDAQQRQLLRAASVFGEVCWQGAVETLLGTRVSPTQLEYDLNRLRERELLVERSDSRFAGEREYAFRHALLREGAYAMLTAADQMLGHRRRASNSSRTVSSTQRSANRAERISRLHGSRQHAASWRRPSERPAPQYRRSLRYRPITSKRCCA
jgi:predicted ATPase